MANRSAVSLAAAAVVALGLPSGPCLAQSSSPSADAARGKAALSVRGKFIDQRIAEFMEKNNVPGLAMAIVQAPYIPRSAAYGRASLAHDELASTRTMWGIGPITQGFTAVAVFQLYEAQKLDIRDAIEKYLPNVPAAWAKTTVLELLQHASGIPDYRTSPNFNEGQAYRPADLVAVVSATPLLFKPGSQVRMSATDFLLLGMIVERASGMSFRDYVTRYQIEPLGLRSTMFVEDFSAKSFLDRPSNGAGGKQHARFKSEIAYINPVEPAVGHKDVDGRLVAVDPKSSANLFAFGSLWSSAEGISVWDIALAGSVLVKREENRALIYKPTRLASGTTVPAMVGWEFTRHPGFMEMKGSSPGFSAYLSRFTAPSDLVCVTLLANREDLDMTGLARDIAESYKADLGAGPGADGVVTQESKFSVDETASRLEALLKAQNAPVFAVFDHGENARQAGLELRPTKVIVFGNPKVGTRLMQSSQSIGLDLPLRVSIWEDERHRVWLSYRDMDRLAAEHGVKDDATVQAMGRALEKLVGRAANVYDY